MVRGLFVKLLRVFKTVGRGVMLIPRGGMYVMGRLHSYGLTVPIMFFSVVVPQMFGAYAFLSQHMEWYIAAGGAVFAPFGGAVVVVANTVTQLAVPHLNMGYAAMLVAGAFSQILTVALFLMMWWYANRVLTYTMGSFHVLLLGGGFMILGLLYTLVLEMYVLPGDATQISGMTYFLQHPGESVEPVAFLLEEHVLGGGADAASVAAENLSTPANISNTTNLTG